MTVQSTRGGGSRLRVLRETEYGSKSAREKGSCSYVAHSCVVVMNGTKPTVMLR